MGICLGRFHLNARRLFDGRKTTLFFEEQEEDTHLVWRSS
jgi:transcriptional regulator GlxA family with amidase domain